MLLVAAIYAGTTHLLLIPLVIVAAASGATLGDNLGFWVGREGAIVCSVASVATIAWKSAG
jgi:membrane protein DedA with SNARE-associated domain